MKKYLIALTLLGAVSVQAEESSLSFPSSQEQVQMSAKEKQDQEVLILEAHYAAKPRQSAAAIEHEKVLKYIDRHDRD